MPNPVGIMTMRDVRGVGLNPKHRNIMTDKLRSLFSNDWLDGLNDDQIYDLFEEFIELPGLTHIGYRKPQKPKPKPLLPGLEHFDWHIAPWEDYPDDDDAPPSKEI